VLGFQEDGTPTSAIDRSATALQTVGVDGVDLVPSGHAVTTPVPADVRQLLAAHRDHLRAVLVVGNFDNSIGDFSEQLAHRLLASPAAIASVATTLANVVAGQGWDGVNVDLESLTPRDTSGLVSFLTSLKAALGAAKTVSVDIQTNTGAAAYASNGYDLVAIGQAVDTVVLMAYDQHGPWENTPGPVGALSWQRAGLAVLLRSVPAAKIELGVAGYGYAWRPHFNEMLSDAGARALVRRHHARARWVARIGEWTAKLRDGSVLWWSDARSFALRASLASADRLGGLAVWSLGLSDRIRS
jgi:spore germination protein YaaH